MHERSRVARAGALSLAVWTILNFAIAVLPAGAVVGNQAHSYAGFNAESTGGAITGQKPESKLWYHNGSWWAAMLSPSANGAHRIWQLVGTTWTDTGTLVDGRASTKEDVLSLGNTLYILSRSSSSSSPHRLRRYTFNGTSYTINSGFPVDVPGAGSETATLARDSSGTLWVTYTSGSTVQVVHTNGSDTSWGSPFVPNVANTSVSSDDISSVISFTDATGPAIGVFWSNQNTTTNYFAVHRDGQPDSSWTLETALAETKGADDHINLKTVEGRVYAAVKTGATSASSPLIRLLARSTSGVWTKHPVANVQESNTRPITMLELDQANRRIYVFYTLGEGTAARGIRYKASPMDGSIAFGSVTTFIQGDNNEPINDATSMKANADGASGIVVLASDGNRYWWNKLGGTGTPNAAPTATGGAASTNEDTSTSVTLAGADAETCDLTFSIVTPPAHGSLGAISNQNCSAGSPNTDTAQVTYTPNTNYSGPDSFTFHVNDGVTDSAPATETITVSPVADAPTANAVSASTPQDTAGTVTLSGSDPETCDLTFSIVTPPVNGSLGSITEGTCVAGSPNTESAQVTYNPNAGFSGPDSFTYKVNDGTADSAPATASITVTNQVPVANAGTATTPEDTATSVTLSGSDVETCELTFSIVAQPTHGSLSAVSGTTCVSGSPKTDTAQVTYTPALNYSGPDLFTFKVNDGAHDSTTATVSLTVSGVNDAPVANAISAATGQNTAVGITLSGSDVESCQLSFTIVTAPSHGSLGSLRKRACVPGTPNTDTSFVTYTPAPGFTGSDFFTYIVNDGASDSIAVAVSITVGGVGNQAPTANAGSASTNEDVATTVTLSGSDAETCDLSFSIVTQPANGTLGPITNQSCAGTGPFTDSATVSYTPASNYNGPDSFTFRVTDGGASSSASATFNITVNAVSDPPTADNGNTSTAQDTPVTVTISGGDIDDCQLSFAIDTQPAHGTLGTPTPQACAGSGPFTDSEQIVYTPVTGYSGADSFTFHTNDGTGDSSSATFSITIAAQNQVPSANTASVTPNEDTATTVNLAGSDVETCELAFSIVTPPAHGILGTIASPGNNCVGGSPNTDTATVTYTPATNYNGPDSFTYRVNDGTQNSAAATASIAVIAVNDEPLAGAGSASTPQDTAVTVNLSGSDVETCELTFSIVAAPTHGSLGTPASANDNCVAGSPNTDSGTVLYTPAQGYSGADSFTFKVNDGTADSSAATINITVSAVNQAPTASAGTASLNEDAQTTITLNGSDPETCQLAFSIVAQPAHGTLGSIANQACVAGSPNTDSATVGYTPALNYNGPDSFTFRVTDGGSLQSAAATITITINAVNDVPAASAGSATTNQNMPVTINLSGSDVETCELIFSIGTAPAHGSLGTSANQVCVAGSPNTDSATVQYTPVGGYSGPDSFTYRVGDGSANSSFSTVNITVNSAVATIAFRAASQGFNNGSATSVVIPSPTGVQAGDVMIACVAARGNPTFTAPAGWNLVRLEVNGFNIRQAIYWKAATASEPASYTWSWSGNQAASGGIMAYSGVSTTNPIVAHSGAFSSATGTSATAPSITTTVDGAMVLAFFGAARNVPINHPAGMTERFDVIANGTFPMVSDGSDVLQATAGATGDKIATWTGTGHWVGQQVALRPSGA